MADHRRAGRSGDVRTEATVKVRANGERMISTAEGNGPVNALDKALRSAVTSLHPELGATRARRLQGPHPREERRRHPYRKCDPRSRIDLRWKAGVTTLGVHENVIAASWRALEDALTYGLMRSQA